MSRTSKRSQRWVAISVALAVASSALLLGGGSVTRAAARTPSTAVPPKTLSALAGKRLTHLSLTAEVATVHRAQSSARALANAPGMPACTPPPLPAATYPPGNSYGVPFLAAITNGQILSGYDEWTANHPLWTVGSTTYHLYPWQAKVYDVTGWVTGLLQLPNLSASIPANDVVFCDLGGQSCESASPPAGDCIHLSLSGAPQPGQAPPPTITNDPPPGQMCYQAPNFCIPYVVTLTPTGTTTLTVTGVQPDGALMLSVTTAATTTLNITLPGVSETCSDTPTSIALSTQVPAGLPPGAPIRALRGRPDLRGLQTPPLPLTGPLATASSVVASNDFSVAAFSPTACPLLAAVFDAPLGGWNTLPSKDPASLNNNYFDKTPLPAIAGQPGWSQFSATTTVSSLGIPVGPPAGFSLSPGGP